MSYKDLIQGRAADGAGADGLSQESRLIEGQVFKLASSLGQLKRLVEQLGTPKDTVDHRHRISETNSGIQQLAKSIKERITALHGPEAAGSSGASGEQKQKAKKLLQDFANILQDYKATQRIAQDREAASLPRPNPITTRQAAGPASSSPAVDLEQGRGGAAAAAAADEEHERQALLQAQRQKQEQAMDNAIQFNASLIEERDQGIQDIVRQIGEVNEMFQDLAVLINDQGVQVQTIDEHISSTAERIKEGSRELVKAERSQRTTRNQCLCLWLVAAIIVSIIIILMAV